MSDMGKTFIIFGVILTALGVIFTFGGKLSWFGRLPGDIYIQKKNLTLFFPITTSILISVVVSLLFVLFKKR